MTTKTDRERDQTMRLTDLRDLVAKDRNATLVVRARVLMELHDEAVRKDEIIERLRSEIGRAQSKPDGASL